LIAGVAKAYALSPAKLGYRSRAREFFELGLKLNPDDPSLLEKFGHYLILEEGAYDEGFQLYEKSFLLGDVRLNEFCLMDYLSLLYLREDLPSKKFEEAIERALTYDLSSIGTIRTYMASATYEMEYGCTDKAISRLYVASRIEARLNCHMKVLYE
jgi:Tfp pilus assembly protein PilF